MANGFDPRLGAAPSPVDSFGRADVAVDAGLRSYMLSVYNYMASAVLLTGIVALLFARSGAVNSLLDPVSHRSTLLAWLVVLSPLAIVMTMSWGLRRISTGTAQALYWAFAVLIGMSLSTLFLVYTTGSIATTFFATSAAFLSLSLWGYTTKRDLSGFGTFLIMGLVGLVVAMVINVIWPSTLMTLAISALGVLIFAGLTAYDTQRIKSQYFAVRGTDLARKWAIMGALTLYLDFINLFMFLLQAFMGNRR
jgi:FtsH-binding integral membrane protein